MNPNSKLSERLNFSSGIANQDLTTARTGAYQSMANFDRVAALGAAASSAEGSTLTLQLMQAKDASGTGAKTLGAAVVATAGTGGEELVATAEAMASDLDTANDFTHVAVKATAVDAGSPAAAIYGGARMIRGGGRFNPSV